MHKEIFLIKNANDFEEKALAIFRMQAEKLQIYKKFIKYLKINPSDVTRVENIPFLPVELFKSHKIILKGHDARLIFESSGTTGIRPGRHYVAYPEIYDNCLLKAFEYFYGSPSDYTILALLPSYLERSSSSLVYMVNQLIKRTGDNESGFYLYDYDKLLKNLILLKRKEKKVLLIGVSFALLELAEKYSPDLSGITVMETGGMKGRRAEITREELHNTLKTKLNLDNIHSEYGMTELLSQAYSASAGIYQSPPWMKIMIRDPYDPMNTLKEGQAGAVNIIDLANMYSCSFIATSDLGRIIPGKGFEISGRMDNSDIRGCNLLVA